MTRAVRSRDAFVETLPTTMVMEEMVPPRPTFVHVRGAYDRLGERVTPGVPAAFPEMSGDMPRNRLGFARWLVDGRHPLTARVAVNRYWQMFFGVGLVKTAEDFGSQGELPSHPRLLDWLATEFVRLHWDVKALQRLVLCSAAYRQSSQVTPALLRKDPENRLLARGPRLRLSAQAIRDQALFIGGLLVERRGGPSVSPYQPRNLWAEVSNMTYKQSKGADLYRRSLYTYWKRTVAPPTMLTLNAADRETCMVRTSRTNTPLQALTLLNETAFVEAARGFAQRIILEGGETVEQRLAFAFGSALARPPSAAERRVLAEAHTDYLRQYQADPQAAGKLIHVGASPPAAEIDTAELAAWTAVANVLLNLDETITKE